MRDFERTWQQYTSSWKANSETERRALYEASLAGECLYLDPLVRAEGWNELSGYMDDFHDQVPGGHFVTTYFLAHNHKSIAKWEMRSGDDAVLSEGVSFGEYNSEGKLVSMTGFFETPEGS